MVDIAFDDMKVKFDRANMLRNSLQKNLDRRKKLNLGDDAYVRDLMNDIAKADEEVAYLRKKLRSMESQRIRSSNIDGNLEIKKKGLLG
ncbi:MAG: hypothetical protein AABW59_05535 [archaeon]